MTLYKTGRICVKVVGREAGSHCVIVEQKETNYVVVTGPKKITGVRRRLCNIRHLEPLETVLEISAGADDEAVTKAIAAAGLTEKFREKIRFDL
ncbi:50S ribosomal protein L14e [Candidatus Thorarchaeota archaeon]|nr:MAG: 50S ribosomal protein L14e [Candidatus Thorarchaeota archaeon]